MGLAATADSPMISAELYRCATWAATDLQVNAVSGS
jgi:hypothetical protein